MYAYDIIDDFINRHHNFKNSEREKREIIADALYVSFGRSGTDLKNLEYLNTEKAIDLNLFNNKSGNIYNFIFPPLVPLAKQLFKRKGNGTPNASSGKGELLFHLFSPHITRPTKGDVKVLDKKYEVKANGGKIGLGKGNKINEIVVKKCEELKIRLPIAQKGVTAKGKPQFDPNKQSHKLFLGENYATVLGIWWEAFSGSKLPDGILDWQELIPHAIKLISKPVFQENDGLMCITNSGDFEIFKSVNDILASKYNSIDSEWEIRCYQSNAISLYLGK
jgi:hypothetical protein